MKTLKAVGTSFQKDNWKKLFKEETSLINCNIKLVPEYDNPFDKNAVRVTYENTHLGYMSKPDASLYKSKFEERCTELKGQIEVKGETNSVTFDIDLCDIKNHYVYKIINNINGCYYIGKRSCSCDIEKDTNYMGSGRRLLAAFYEHGVENFTKEILYTFESEREAYAKEAELVTFKEIQDPLCYNLVEGGSDGHQRTLKTLNELWEQIDIISYLSFYRNLEGMSQNELDTQEKSLRAENLNLKSSNSKFRSEEDRMKIWDMRFKQELIKLKKGQTTKERMVEIFCTHDITPLLDAISAKPRH